MLNRDPYLGLRPYHFEESDLFFGREKYIDLLADRLGTDHFIAIVGNSGCGKSSLIRAGLLPTLVLFRIWHVASFRPLNSPFQNLAKSLIKQVNTDIRCPTLKEQYLQHTQLSHDRALKKLAESLADRPENLYHLIPQILPEHRKLLIVIDQFEELFRYDQEKEQVTQFIKCLLKVVEDKNTYVVITIRHEHVGVCADRYPVLFPFLTQKEASIPPLSVEQLRDTIIRPAKVCGGEVENELVEHLLKTSPTDQLPLLQYSLMRMWNEIVATESAQKILTVELYKQLGEDSGKILSDSAERAYADLSPEQQYIAEVLFRRLTAKDDKGNYTRSTVSLGVVAQLTGKNSQTVSEVIDIFRHPSRRFLLPSIDGSNYILHDDSIIDITHESLIRQWERLKTWVDAEYELFKNYEQVDTAAYNWERFNKSEDELILGDALRKREVWLSEIRNLYKTDEQAQTWYLRRYGGQFQRVLEFLEQSRAKQTRLEAREQELQKQADDFIKQSQVKQALLEAREQELKKKADDLRKVSLQRILAVSIAVLMATLGYVAYSAKVQRTIELFDSQRIHAALENQIGNYSAAQQLLSKTHQLDSSITPSKLHSRNLLEWFSHFISPHSLSSYQTHQILYEVATSSDGRFIVAVGENGAAIVFDNKTKQRHTLTGYSNTDIHAVIFASNNQWFATGGDDNKIIFWAINQNGEITQFKDSWTAPDKVQTLAISPDNKKIASSGGKNKDISIWDVETNKIVTILQGHTDSINALSFNATGNILASASSDETTRLWDMSENKEIHLLQGHTDKVQAVSFIAPEDALLATAGNDNTIRIWDVKTGKSQDNPWRGHTDKIFGLRSVANGKYLISASNDRSLRLWDIESGVGLQVLQEHTANVSGVTTYDNQIVSVSTDGTIKHWNAEPTSQYRISLKNEPTSTAISPDAKRVAVGLNSGDLYIYPLSSEGIKQPPVTELKVHDLDVTRLAFNSTGTLLATAGRDCSAKLWQIKEGKLQPEPVKIIPHQRENMPCLNADGESTAGVSAVAFSPDDQILATSSYDGKIALLNIVTKTISYHPVHNGKDVNTVAFDATGTKLLTASDDEIYVWKVQDFKTNSQHPIDTKKQQGLIWASLDAQAQHYIGVGRGNYSVNVYEQGRDQTKYELTGHNQSIIKSVFSPDNQQAITAGADGTIWFWDLQEHSALFSLRLPTQKGSGNFSPLWDFDFRCAENGKGHCWLAAPLTHGELVLYDFGTIYTP